MGYMVLATSGHAAIAAAVKANRIDLAWGDLPPYLAAPTGESGSAVVAASSLSVATHEYKITTINEFGETLVSGNIAVVIDGAGKTANLSWTPVTYATGYNVYKKVGAVYKFLATVVAAAYIDNGSATPTLVEPPVVNTTSIDPWSTTPPVPNLAHKKLYREVGRRKVVISKFVIPDVNGAYVTANGKWTEVAYPTPYLYLYVAFDLTDAQTATIYQLGLFLDTIPTGGNEAKTYLLPNEIADQGDLLSIEHTSPIYRNASTREIHEVVITF